MSLKRANVEGNSTRVLTGQYPGTVVTISHSDVEHNAGRAAVLTGHLAYGNKSPKVAVKVEHLGLNPNAQRHSEGLLV